MRCFKPKLIFFIFTFCLVGILLSPKNSKEKLKRLYRTYAIKFSTAQESITPFGKPFQIDKTFIITLKQDPSRVRFVEQQVARADFPSPYEIFPAIYGKAMSKEEVYSLVQQKIITKKGINTLRPGEIGCILSHWNLWKKISETEVGEIFLVLEDDAIIISNFKLLWEEKSIEIPENFDFLFLYNFPEKTDLTASNHPSIYFPNHLFCSHGYVISKKGAKKLLNQLFPITKPIDTGLDRLYGSQLGPYNIISKKYRNDDFLRIYSMQPNLVESADMPSNIQQIAKPSF